MAKLEELVVEIKASQEQFIAEMRTSIDALKKFENASDSAAGAAEDAGQKFDDMGDGAKKGSDGLFSMNKALDIAKGILVADLIQGGLRQIKDLLMQGAREALSFQQAIAEINSILPDNQQLTREASEALRDYSVQFGTGQTQQAKAYYEIISAGISDTTKATKLLEVANKAARAGMSNVQTAIGALTSALAVYESQGLDATRASDVLFVAVREGKVTFDSIAQSIGRVIPLAKTAGVSFDEVSGAVSFLTKVGLSTEEAVTGLRTMFTAILKPAKESTDAARSLGIEFNAAALQTKGLAGFMEEVIRATGGSAKQLALLFRDVQGLNAASAIANGNFEDFTRILDATRMAGGETSKAFKTLTKDVQQFKLDQASASFKELGSAIADIFLPALTNAAAATGAVAKNIADELQGIKAPPNLEADLQKVEKRLEEMRAKIAGPKEITFGSIFAGQTKVSIEALQALEAEQARLTEEILKQRARAAASQQVQTGQDTSKAEIEAAQEKSDAILQIELNRNEASKALAVDLLEYKAEKEAQAMELERLRSEESFGTSEEANALELSILEAKFQEEQEILKNALEQKFITESEYEKASTALKTKAEKEKTRIEQEQNKARAQNFQDTLSFLATAANSSNKTLAAIGKAAAIARATQDTYAAANKALASAPPPFNYALAGAVTAVGLGNVAKIAGVGLQSGIDEVPGVGTRDNFPAVLAPGERVVPAKTNQDLTRFLENPQSNNPSMTFNITLNDIFTSDPREIGAKVVESINQAAQSMGVKILAGAIQ